MFGERLPELRETLAAHLALVPYERDWACALVVSLVNRAWFRVGSERYARTSRTYGVTTLSKRHASVRGRRVDFRFRSKQRLLVRRTVVDAELAEAVRALLGYPGGPRLFRFDRDGTPANLTGAILNDHIAAHLAEGYTAKDFRTWGGTLEAALAFAEHGPPASAADERRTMAAVMRRVGAELGNTPAVARVVCQPGGRRAVAGRPHARGLPRAAPPRRHGAGLENEEAALLSLLRSWRIRRSRAAA